MAKRSRVTQELVVTLLFALGRLLLSLTARHGMVWVDLGSESRNKLKGMGNVVIARMLGASNSRERRTY